MTITGMGTKRLFIGNLFPEVTTEALQERFSKFGSVSKIEIKNKKDIDGKISQTFAFIDIGVSDSQLSQCISTLANKKWKGYLVTVQQARESFMERLARERKEREDKESSATPSKDSIKLNKRIHEDEEFRIVDNKIPKTDFTEEREAFLGFGRETQKKEKYDPLKLFKSKLAGDENPVPVKEIPNTENLGKVENGIVMFEDNESGQEALLAVNKKYHSSSEEEEDNEKNKRVREKHIKSKKNKVKEDIRSAEFKEKMTKRFLEKQKIVKESHVGLKHKVEKQNNQSKGKTYVDTSEESESEEVGGKTGTDVLKTFQTFSNFWQDSDEEDEHQGKRSTASTKEQSEKSFPVASQFSDDSSDSDKTEDEITDKIRENEPQQQLVSDVSMQRYDPTRAEHEIFHRSNNAEIDTGVKGDIRPRKFFEVKSDLKKVFGSGPEKTGFSFGFNKEEENKTCNEKFSFSFDKASVDVHSEEEKIDLPNKKDDIASKFGLQLKGKGVPKSENSFFFAEEDPRLEEGLSFFFDTEIDLDKLRNDFNEKRPILSDILKKRARSKAKRKESSKTAFGKKKLSWRKGGKRKKFD